MVTTPAAGPVVGGTTVTITSHGAPLGNGSDIYRVTVGDVDVAAIVSQTTHEVRSA